MRKHGLRMAGLCLAAALSMMAFAAASAQAEPGSHWNVNGSAIASGLLPFLQIEIEELKVAPVGKHLVLLTKILGNLFHILCGAASLKEFHLLTEGGSLGKIRFSSCKILVGTEVQEACEPKTEGVDGVIETKLLKDLLVLVGGRKLDRLEPNEGTTFVTIETKGECSVGTKIPVIGKFFIKDCQNELSNEKVVHLIEEDEATELWVISKTEEHKSKIDGSVNIFMTGVAHEGLNWSGTV